MKRFFLGTALGLVLGGALILGLDWATPRNCYPAIPTLSAHWLKTSFSQGWVVDSIWDPGGLDVICLRRPLLPSPPAIEQP